MTIEEVLDSLPNGLHDAQLQSVNIDYAARTAELHLDIWVGDMSPDGEAREACRPVILKLSGLWYFVVEAPDPKYDFHEPKPLWIDAGVAETVRDASSIKLPKPPEGTFKFWIFVHDWNAFIRVAALDANVESPLPS